MGRQPGTISAADMFGWKSKLVKQPSAVALASGLQEVKPWPALWFVALIGVLVLSRVLWERAS